MTKTKTINGLAFEVSQPYKAGQAINEAEAKALNQTRSENIGNNLRPKIKEMQDAEAPFEEIKALVAEADASYVFSMASVSASRRLDPYEREARKIARDLIKDHLAKDGRKLTVAPEGLTDEEWKEQIESETDRIASSPTVLKAATKAVDAKRKTADSLMESIGEVAV